jgi:hypothetical protein
MVDGVEILTDSPMAQRGKRIMQAMREAIPESLVTREYRGKDEILILYGAGLAQRQHAMRTHLKRGGRVVCWDLGYWDRETAMRLSIDGMHPTAAQLELSPTEPRRTFTLRNDSKPDGPVLLVGLGDKSADLLGLRRQEWERLALKRIRTQYPGRQIVWRPKGRAPYPLDNLQMLATMPIEDALRGCSLVVCRHSNVAIDACVAGIPVECEGGAAGALYAGNIAPDEKSRLEFLSRLSYWNWKPEEAAQAWKFIKRVCDATERWLRRAPD